ncbi:hypothetical protein PBT90_00155 [Algoriphagus halophytocola]|uniref:Uncharacterized protein n=1 Tax=Algoriphagus halophytocola TaxID=2991499 RepID=A0ABY6MDQ1_9BACT|nr:MULTISPECIES: hypothetical protein [unclassified Algoriphagus]UZD21870.1 hypothetical protein OM944_14480 [Algoriphagus sp. TR-M5]WBL43120.1 hypothetical protein PBT90_00155 [Algoriphagus sp. TR-M9]
MTIQINSNYLENYAQDYATTVCDQFFAARQYMTGQDIVQLTNSTQVNFFIIKRLFELWQEELAKLKSNPYFDYRDVSVHEALTQFMNVLSKRIKVEREHLQPLLEIAVQQAIVLATDPVGFYQNEVRKAPENQINEYLKENKKYYKWHSQAITFLIDKAGFGHDEGAYIRAIAANYQAIEDSMESVNLLVATLGEVKPFDLDTYFQSESPAENSPSPAPEPSEEENKSSFFDQMENEPEPVTERVQEPAKPLEEQPKPKPVIPVYTGNGGLDPDELRAKFETLSYKGMKGIMGELGENVAINQRFMFTKELFDGNADLLRHALKSIDQCGSFDEAIGLVNSRYVSELDWSPNTEPVQEFLLLVYRKFEV